MSYINGPKIINTNLVFCYDFANTKCYSGSGTSVIDMTGLSNNGELVNSPVYSSSILTNNKFFSFNSNTVLRIPNNTNLDTQTVSVEAWIKTNALNQNGFFFEKGTVNSQYSLFQEGTNIQWRLVLNGSYNTLSTTTATYLNTTNWFQIVGTYTAGSRRLYINGIQRNADAASGTVATNSGGMSIGAYGGYSGSRGYYYNGSVGIIRVYNTVLSASQIYQNFIAIKNRFGIL